MAAPRRGTRFTPASIRGLVFAGGIGCAAPSPGAVVVAPSVAATTPRLPPRAPPLTSARGAPAACEQEWTLGDTASAARLVVVCSDDVRRQSLAESEAVSRALSSALEPARQRVCSCAGRLRPPAFVDLVFTEKPEDGRATVEATATDEDDADPELGPPFAACFGTVVAAFAPFRTNACASAGRATFIYPVRMDLAP